MDALALRIAALCVAAAMLCASLRPHRPELAAALSLAVGVGVLASLAASLPETLAGLGEIVRFLKSGGDALPRAAGVAVIAELGAQVCSDAGEGALAGRIRLAARAAMLALCAPLLAETARCVAGLLSLD